MRAHHVSPLLKFASVVDAPRQLVVCIVVTVLLTVGFFYLAPYPPQNPLWWDFLMALGMLGLGLLLAAPLVTPEDFDNALQTLNFAGTAGETQTFTVPTLDDAVLETTETFTVSLAASDALVDASDTGTGTITVMDAQCGNRGICGGQLRAVKTYQQIATQ